MLTLVVKNFASFLSLIFSFLLESHDIRLLHNFVRYKKINLRISKKYEFDPVVSVLMHLTDRLLNCHQNDKLKFRKHRFKRAQQQKLV